MSQRALRQTPWKEYFSGGKNYYYNVCSANSFPTFAYIPVDNDEGVQVGDAGGAFVAQGDG